MRWSKYHIQSEQHAIAAELASKSHDNDLAIKHYGLAAKAEVNALNCLSPDKTRTIGITVVSATSLYFMAQDFSQARIVAQKWLATESLPPFAIEELNDLLQDIQSSITKQNTLNRLLPDGQFRDQANFRPNEVILLDTISSQGLISDASLSFEELQRLQTRSFAELLPILEELERRDLIQKIPNDGTTTYKVSPLLPGASDSEPPTT